MKTLIGATMANISGTTIFELLSMDNYIQK